MTAGLHAVEDGRHRLQAAEIDVKCAQGGHDDEVRQDEGPAAGPGPPESATQIRDIDPDLNGERSRQRLADRDRLAHLLLGEPFTVVDEFPLHLADQRNRAAKAKAAEPQEVTDQFPDPAFRNDCCRRHLRRQPVVLKFTLPRLSQLHSCGEVRGRGFVDRQSLALRALSAIVSSLREAPFTPDVSFRCCIVGTASPRCPSELPPYRCRHSAQPPHRSPCDRRAHTYRARAPAGHRPVSWYGLPPIG